LLSHECVKQGAFSTYINNAGVAHCPGDIRNKLPAGGGYAFISYSGASGLNGAVWASFGSSHPIASELLTKLSSVRRPSSKFVFIEENDSRGENYGAWVMSVSGTAVNNWAGSGMLDSPAAFHITSSTFSWADGHASSRRWIDGATVAFAANTSPGKFGSIPGASAAPNDTSFLVDGYAFLGNE
jgi:hypothetical protein